MFNHFISLLFWCYCSFHGLLCLELNSYTACYGSTGLANFLRPTCESGDKMAVVGLKALAKTQSTECPVEITPFNEANTNRSVCCQYEPEDCSVLYSTAVYRNYFQGCNGQNSCSRQVSWVETPCNQSVYLPRTNFMVIEFYCISDQALDPCASLDTKDNKVFLWNAGYPTTSSVSGTSCTCSVEASCDSKIRLTAIDIRFDTSGTCEQSISATDNTSVSNFDCSSNNDYLPTVLYTSSSHFLNLQIVDNQGDGYYFILLEGTAVGSELTLACSNTAQTTPTVVASSLPECPDGGTTTMTPDVTTTDVEISTIHSSSGPMTTDSITATINNTTTEVTSASMTTDSTTLVSDSTITDVTSRVSLATASTTVKTNSTTEEVTVSITMTTESTTVKSDSTITDVTTKEYANQSSQATFTTNERQYETSTDINGTDETTDTVVTVNSTSMLINVSDSSMNPVFSSLSWTLTENEKTATILSTSNTSYTTNKPDLGQSTSAESTANLSLIIGIVVVILMLIGLVAIIVMYKDKIKDCCNKTKTSSKVDVKDSEENPIYASIFDDNLNIENRPKPLQLPPLTHHFPLMSRPVAKMSHEDTKMEVKTKRTVEIDHDIFTRQYVGNPDLNQEKRKKKKRKKKKVLKKLKGESELEFKPKVNSYTKSTFPVDFSISSEVHTGRYQRRMSVIDISNSEGMLEKTVEI